MRKLISRSVLIYSILVLLLGIGLYQTSRSWWDRGRMEKKMQQKVAAKESISVRYYVGVYGPKAMLINSGLCVLLLAAGPWGLRKLHGRVPEARAKESPRTTLAVVTIAIAGAALMALPRLHHGLWADEMTSMLKFTVGEYERDAEGKMQYDPVEAEYRQFSLKTPNNHLLYNNLAGTLHQATVAAPTEPQETYFKEWVLRLPALLAGLASILSLTWLAGELGFRKAGWLAVLLLILHPWHLRYTSEARGYSVIMACVPALLTAGLLAIRTGRWRWWALFTLLEVVMMDTWPLAVVIVFMANLTVGAWLLTSRWDRSDRVTLFFRWMMWSVVGAMVAIQLLLPCLPQIQEYMRFHAGHVAITGRTVLNVTVSLFTGSAWNHWDPNNPVLYSWQVAWGNHPVGVSLFFVLLGVLFVAGLVKLCQTSKEARLMAVMILMIPLGILGYSAVTKNIFLLWYWVPAVPGLALVLGIGALSLLKRAGAKETLALCACLVALFAFAFHPQHLSLWRNPVQQNKEAAQITRKYLNPTQPDYGKESITGFVSSFFKGYDNEAVGIVSVAHMEELMARSDGEKRPFYVNLARADILGPDGDDLLKKLRDPSQFDLIATLYGHDYEGTRYVYQYRNKVRLSVPPNP